MKIVVYPASDKSWSRPFARDFPAHEWRFAASPAELESALARADILVLPNSACTPELGTIVRAAAALKWIHFTTAGVERGVGMGLPEGIVVSHAPGIRANMVAEHALALLLALVRRLPLLGRDQRAHRWRRETVSARMGTLGDKTVCVVGLGPIGREIARRLRVFNARVIAVSRAGTAGGDIEEVFPRTRLLEALSQADAIVLCTSSDDTSRHLIDARALAAFRGEFLVNVGRGSLIDENALIAALRARRFGVALDVQETEPLPESSPLWDMPGVIISPHSAGAGASGYAAHRTLFAENLARFEAGKPLANQVSL